MARTQYFSAPTSWKSELNLPLRNASADAGYKARLAILNGANWEDHGIPYNAHEPSFNQGWHAAEIDFERKDWTLEQHAQLEAEATMNSLEYRAHMHRQSQIAQRIAEIETAANIAAAAEESFFLQ